jgi:N-acetylmuramoyl-L-alanine amidase
MTLQGVHNDVTARAICANAAHADILIGIYFNAGGSPRNAGSITAYDTARPFAAANQKLAQLVHGNVLASMNAHGWQIPNDGVVSDSALGSHGHSNPSSPLARESAAYHHLLLLGPAQAGYFSTPSQMPGVIVEPLYLTDPFEGSIAASAEGQHAIATGIATAVEQDLMPPSTP